MARDLSTSPFARLMRIGRVTTRVGTSLATRRALDAIFSTPGENLRRTEHFVRNAHRVTEALGELKGAAMKVGQMLSVHEGFLPPEVCAVLQQLQSEAPAVPWPRMEQTLEAEVPGGLDAFEQFDRTPLAAASIGQVYRARLRDGRDVAVKVQYPDIDRVVAADLVTLKKLFGSLIEMFVDIDFEPLWVELRARLLEELDYEREASNVERMRAHYADDDTVLIPGVVQELSTRRVLVLDYVRGISPGAATSGAYPQELRDLWGRQLLRFVMSGLVQHRFLHADPNFGNFAFREDGHLVVYDHGCVKDVPEAVATAARAFSRRASTRTWKPSPLGSRRSASMTGAAEKRCRAPSSNPSDGRSWPSSATRPCASTGTRRCTPPSSIATGPISANSPASNSLPI